MAYHERKKQACAALALMALSLMLVACGKKPSVVDPPPTVEEDHFPLPYPDPATDPKP